MRADKKTPNRTEKKSPARTHKRGVVGYSKKTALLEEAITQMNAGKYGRSSAALKELLGLDPLNAEARRLFATLHLRLGSLMTARTTFESLAKEALQRQDYWLAESLLREYLVAGPRCVTFLEMLAHVYEDKGDPMAAVTEYGKAIEILVEDPDPDRPTRAEELYAMVLQLAPASPVAFRLASMFDAGTGALTRTIETTSSPQDLPEVGPDHAEKTVTIKSELPARMPWDLLEDSAAAFSPSKVDSVPSVMSEQEQVPDFPTSETVGDLDAEPPLPEATVSTEGPDFQFASSPETAAPAPLVVESPTVSDETASAVDAQIIEASSQAEQSLATSDASAPAPHSSISEELTSKTLTTESDNLSAPMPWEQVEEIIVSIPPPTLEYETVGGKPTEPSVPDTELVPSLESKTDLPFSVADVALTEETAADGRGDSTLPTLPPVSWEEVLAVSEAWKSRNLEPAEISPPVQKSGEENTPVVSAAAASLSTSAATPELPSIANEIPASVGLPLSGVGHSLDRIESPPESETSSGQTLKEVEEHPASMPQAESIALVKLFQEALDEGKALSEQLSHESPTIPETQTFELMQSANDAPGSSPLPYDESEVVAEVPPVEAEPAIPLQIEPVGASEHVEEHAFVQGLDVGPATLSETPVSDPLNLVEAIQSLPTPPVESEFCLTDAPSMDSEIINRPLTIDAFEETRPDVATGKQQADQLSVENEPLQFPAFSEPPQSEWGMPTFQAPRDQEIQPEPDVPVAPESQPENSTFRVETPEWPNIPTQTSEPLSETPHVKPSIVSAVDVLFGQRDTQEHVSQKDPTPRSKPGRRLRLRLSHVWTRTSFFILNCFATTRSIVLSIVALAGTGLAITIIGLAGLGLVWMVMEERPSSAFHNLNTTPLRTLPEMKKNGYLLLLGFDVKPNQDPVQAGYERKFVVGDLEAAKVCMGNGETAVAPRGSASAHMLGGWFEAADPAARIGNEVSRLKAWIAQSDTALTRYRQWLKMPFEDWGHGQPVSPHCPEILYAHRLYAAGGFLSNIEPGIEHLEADLMAWRSALAHARTLPMKMMAIEAIDDDVAVASGLLARPDLDAKFLPPLMKMVRPLDQVEQSLRWPMQSQFVLSAKTLDADLAENQWQERPIYVSIMAAMPVPKQKRFNAYAEYYEAAMKQSELSQSTAVKRYAYVKTPAERWMDYLLNPIDNVVGIEPLPAWDLYSGRIRETDARLRLASLQALVRRGPQDGELVTRIAKAGQNYYDPFTGLPMLVNVSKGRMYSVGKDGKDNDAESPLDVSVAIPKTALVAGLEAKRSASSAKSK